VKNLFLSIVVVLCGFLLSLFRSIEMTIYRRGWFLLPIFQTTQAKKSVIPIDKATINASFEKYPI
jgi:hypothetical protein